MQRTETRSCDTHQNTGVEMASQFFLLKVGPEIPNSKIVIVITVLTVGRAFC